MLVHIDKDVMVPIEIFLLPNLHDMFDPGRKAVIDDTINFYDSCELDVGSYVPISSMTMINEYKNQVNAYIMISKDKKSVICMSEGTDIDEYPSCIYTDSKSNSSHYFNCFKYQVDWNNRKIDRAMRLSVEDDKLDDAVTCAITMKYADEKSLFQMFRKIERKMEEDLANDLENEGNIDER